MILQALYDYYQRKAADVDSNIAPEGWEWKELPFLVVINQAGDFVRFEDTREGDGRLKRARKFLVPQSDKRTIGIKAFLLWDNIEYVLGANPRNRSDIGKRTQAFLERVESIVDGHPDIKSVFKFIKNDPLAQVEKCSPAVWPEMLEGNVFVTFKVEGSLLDTVCAALPKTMPVSSDAGSDVCLITGEKVQAARLHPSIKGVKDANTTGAAIVSFNLSAFCSYGKDQNRNAPVGDKATFAYTTALNRLLGKESLNKVSIADATMVFWSQKPANGFDLESNFGWFFKSDNDDPDKGVASIKSLFQAVESGRLPLDEGDQFYVLGLAPNAARLSVRFWKTGAVQDFAVKIYQHFRDFEIARGPKDLEFLSLYQILTSLVLAYKMDNVPPNLAGAMVFSVLEGTPYPRTLLQQCVRRIRAEQHVTRARAAILKASMNRFNRFYNKGAREVTVSLDRMNVDPGYRMGRLFAVLEKIQEESSPGTNATIRDRFYGAASSTPVTVFPRLLKLKNHHLAKLNPGRKVQMEKEIQEVMAAVQKFPSCFTLDAQAMFAVGYYHQRQDFFTKKDMDNK
ncbi:MAG: type I-C CRISPR-associated protein Cas8c/Csd1 [Candidatus Omnitrophica bacterium]|nr:type I-C CRISPR-associated protein Cas8c/Csd1 [Candidatus Omnitrophota bacterium]